MLFHISICNIILYYLLVLFSITHFYIGMQLNYMYPLFQASVQTGNCLLWYLEDETLQSILFESPMIMENIWVVKGYVKLISCGFSFVDLFMMISDLWLVMVPLKSTWLPFSPFVFCGKNPTINYRETNYE